MPVIVLQSDTEDQQEFTSGRIVLRDKASTDHRINPYCGYWFIHRLRTVHIHLRSGATYTSYTSLLNFTQRHDRFAPSLLARQLACSATATSNNAATTDEREYPTDARLC